MVWHLIWFSKDQPHPGWSGFMKSTELVCNTGKAEVIFFPMIDHSPSDLSCIYSTLLFIARQAIKMQVTPIVTFDQPLFSKAIAIISTESADSVLKFFLILLGGFHTRMNFLGCIGHFMQETGLAEILDEIYANNSVKHILSGKAVSRAIRAHNIVNHSLHVILLPQFYENCDEPNDKIEEIDALYRRLSTISSEELTNNSPIKTAIQNVQRERSRLQNSRTASMWFQYMDMVDILHRFIAAERSGNWVAHLTVLFEMLPYFAAAGHSNYTKAVYIHLQNMLRLKLTNPELYSKFENGNFVIHRSDRNWTGLSPDLIIEQVFMRCLKSVGGLTRGNGMSEVQRTIWTQSMHLCAQVNEKIQEFTGSKYFSSKQHFDSSNSRMKLMPMMFQKL